MNNGIIRNREVFKQSILFEGLRVNPRDKRTGTDIDFEYEDGKTWIRCEVKKYGTDLTIGQKILLERFYKSINGYSVFVFLLWHKEPKENDIYIKDTIVSKFYYKGRWFDVINLRGDIKFKTVFNKLV